MPPDARPPAGNSVAIADVVDVRQSNFLQRVVATQAFWVTISSVVIVAIMTWLQPDAFGSAANLYNVTRNFAFIAIMALGMTAVIVTGGIDLSVGSIMGVTGVVMGLMMQAGSTWWAAVLGGLATGGACGAFNGALISYVGLSPFVVTLGTLAILRSMANVLSGTRIISDFGTAAEPFSEIVGGDSFGFSNSVWVLLALWCVFAAVLRYKVFGRHLFAVGGNEHAARLTGVPVDRVKMLAYVISGLTAAVATIMVLGWTVSANPGLGIGYELRVIAATVIGGANLAGGEGTAFGALIGAVLIELIRNSLNMAGIDSNWQGMFVGGFLILAVLLDRLRGRKRE